MKSRNVYEASIRLKVKVLLYDKNSYKTLVLQPYMTETVDDTSITVISFMKPSCALLKSTFAIKKNEISIVPYDFVLPTERSTKEEALKQFSKYRNKMICDCDVQANPTRCNCPSDSISSIKTDITNILPVSSPFVKVVSKNGAITALSRREEMTVATESKYMRDSAHYIVQQNSNINLTNLMGCYNCQGGATVIASCSTEIPAWVIIQCDDHSFSVECNPNAKLSLITLDYQQAVVRQNCRVTCNDRLIKILL
ncbi:hypothetical protein RB195_014205 [Necator americanus]|uniref:Phlebovirus glycoprotein G2 fusion domain-containing protein n=1 Tax=Necator americanus TaxID=51031 RepID=A0ABR1DZ86_NECAM